jgi:hypothetical protein
MGPRSLTLDACPFNLSIADGRVRVFRRRDEIFADNCLLERDRFGGGSVVVWAGIIGGRMTDLVVIRGNLNANATLMKLCVQFLSISFAEIPVCLCMTMLDHIRLGLLQIIWHGMALTCYHDQRVLQTGTQ